METKKIPLCQDCGNEMRNGGYVGWYCITPGCDTLEKARRRLVEEISSPRHDECEKLLRDIEDHIKSEPAIYIKKNANYNGFNSEYTTIGTSDVLKEWLRDGSIEHGDKVFIIVGVELPDL